MAGRTSVTDISARTVLGEIACFTWYGTGVTYHAVTGPCMGRAKLSLDGTDWERVANLHAETEGAFTVAKKDLPPGYHTLSIQVLERSDPRSMGSLVTVDAFGAVP